MSAVLRAWLGFAALGAGLIHLALVVGSSPAIGIPLLLIGSAEFAWGVFAFTRPTLPVPHAARIGVLVPLLGWALLLGVTAAELTPGLRVLPMLVASLLDAAVAIGISLVLRRADRGTADRPLPAGRYLLALGAGALVIAALTTPALAATEAGGSAVPHGEIDLPGLLHGH